MVNNGNVIDVDFVNKRKIFYGETISISKDFILPPQNPFLIEDEIIRTMVEELRKDGIFIVFV